MAEEKILVVEFDNYPGEEVHVLLSPFPISGYRSVFDAYQATIKMMRPAELGKLSDLFAPLLRSWSFPEPCSRVGLDARDSTFFVALVRAWINGVRSAPIPLPRESSGGVSSPAGSANGATTT